MAAEVLVGAERRVLISATIPASPPPPPESLLGRLDQIDLRLRQLEEEQRRRPSASPDAAANPGRGRAHHQHSKSMPSSVALQQHQQVLIRGTLMDRLDLLESRIRQLSSELDLDAIGDGNGKVPAEDRAWSEPPPLPEPRGDPRARPAAGAASWSAVQILQRGARQLHHRNGKPSPAKKAKKLKEAKCACEEEKRKAERSSSRASGRRWFTVGC